MRGLEVHMDRPAQRQYWEGYWVDQTPSLAAKTMTQILDRIKFDYLQNIMPAQGRTLEVGCGSGRLSCQLAMRGHRTIGLDFAVRALVAARANYEFGRVHGTFVVGDAFHLPFHAGSVDAILSTGLLEHFEDPSPIVREMVRVLRTGGLFYSDIVPKKFSLFRSLDWAGRLKRLVTRESFETFYERRFTSRQIIALLVEQGLTQVRAFPAGVVPPYLPLLYRSRRLREAEVSLVERTQAFWKRFDGTWLAEWLGFYYFACGIKA
jgi:ubiquinone/menaquinone biosynthesis C-methylase UbiE